MYTSILQKIPVLIALVFLVIAVTVIYFRSKNINRAEIQKILKTANYLEVWVLITSIVLTATFGVFNYMNSRQWVKAVVSLNYSEASGALNSNGTRYNSAEITSDEVIERAIELGAWEDVTVKELKKCLSVYPYVQGGVGDKSEYHISTEFVVEYYASKDTQHLDPENVIKLITSAYKEYYIENYTDNFSNVISDKTPDFETMEYMDIVSYFEKETSSVLNYLYGMAAKSQSFVSGDNATFNQIAGKVHQFKVTQVEENLKSLVLQGGVSRDKNGYTQRLKFLNDDTDFDRQKQQVSFEICNRAIEMYSKEMTRVVLVPTWDQEGKYYMGRTKVGIDELSQMATNFSDNVATKEKEIMDNDLIISKMNATSGSDRKKAEVDELIKSIAQSLKNFQEEAIKAGREYLGHSMNQCIAVSISGASMLGALKDMFLFMIFAYVSVMLYAISKKFPGKE